MSLEVRDVISGYGDAIILQGVSITAKRSSITVLLGANGAGKSTLLNTIVGILRPRSGKILMDGEDISGIRVESVFKKKLAYVLQSRSVFPFMSVRENLEVGGLLIGDKEKIKSKINEMYDIFPSLKIREKVDAGKLSGGEQRMLEVARALMSEPKILILDEPSLGLAPNIVKIIFEKIREINDKLGVTILLAEQNVRMALQISHYGYVLELGRNKAEGPSESLLKDKELARYILGV